LADPALHFSHVRGHFFQADSSVQQTASHQRGAADQLPLSFQKELCVKRKIFFNYCLYKFLVFYYLIYFLERFFYTNYKFRKWDDPAAGCEVAKSHTDNDICWHSSIE
jgi:hypothetical protein